MSRTVHCKKYDKELPCSGSASLPGPKGQEIFETVSKQAWGEWQAHQTMLINEKQLNMMNADDRKYLQNQMDRFLNNEDFDRAEGFVPESE